MAAGNATGATAKEEDVPLHERIAETTSPGCCPACGEIPEKTPVEEYGRFRLFGCPACGLHFWEPRKMPDAHWYEQMYGGRDEKLLPLEPGHKYFLADAAAPRTGELLDIGCGTGNFLAAARDAGYQVSGIELDRNAARFVKEKLRIERVFPFPISDFAEQQPASRFDVITFFEVLEHQADPEEFLRGVRSCLRPGGVIALSVPNRERWLTGPDVLDYPPNHFLRWNGAALRGFLGKHGFEVLSLREEPASYAYTRQMINMALRTGISRPAEGEASSSFRDLMQMAPQQAKAAMQANPTIRQRAVQFLGRVKQVACVPLALAAYPVVRARGLKGTYLYCLARDRGGLS